MNAWQKECHCLCRKGDRLKRQSVGVFPWNVKEVNSFLPPLPRILLQLVWPALPPFVPPPCPSAESRGLAMIGKIGNITDTMMPCLCPLYKAGYDWEDMECY
ncbi:hypothetical protein PoB_007611100 [Plakobranchus ocellatus]|uniref:Uncharacterized protein n=1 Tax=Plakobranchus ocellatus TaxID=259542 RepID=A0AAV4E0I4_9GAST|nr:hypothetical protein PoB_007611100 [Plakobranchus ocellatus]